mmetsp:Transcript_94216/g.288247  ORF Transcript_94216/g.288247 Transcript_94216/m.288247 type:complete len:209 (-) Transcript_94216:518-1144(-)
MFTDASSNGFCSAVKASIKADVASCSVPGVSKSRKKSVGFACVGAGCPHSAKYAGASAIGPQKAMRPGLEVSNTSVSNTSATSLRGWWITTNTRTFNRLATTRKALMQSSASVADRPDVGSSQKSSEACAATPRASVTRRRWPPEMLLTSGPPMISSATSAILNASRITSIQSPMHSCERIGCLLSVALKRTASRTVQCDGIMSSCPT